MITKKSPRLTFKALVETIRRVDADAAARAGRAVNVSLTLRNWAIGFYIAEYEMKGADRAKYGENLLSRLARQLEPLKISNCNRRQLYRYLRFYQLYPSIVGTLSAQSAESPPTLKGTGVAHKIVRSATAQSHPGSQEFLSRLSCTHIEQLVAVKDPTARAFYHAGVGPVSDGAKISAASERRPPTLRMLYGRH